MTQRNVCYCDRCGQEVWLGRGHHHKLIYRLENKGRVRKPDEVDLCQACYWNYLNFMDMRRYKLVRDRGDVE